MREKCFSQFIITCEDEMKNGLTYFFDKEVINKIISSHCFVNSFTFNFANNNCYYLLLHKTSVKNQNQKSKQITISPATHNHCLSMMVH